METKLVVYDRVCLKNDTNVHGTIKFEGRLEHLGDGEYKAVRNDDTLIIKWDYTDTFNIYGIKGFDIATGNCHTIDRSRVKRLGEQTHMQPKEPELNKYYRRACRPWRYIFEVKQSDPTHQFRLFGPKGSKGDWQTNGFEAFGACQSLSNVEAYEFMVRSGHDSEARHIWAYLTRDDRHKIFTQKRINWVSSAWTNGPPAPYLEPAYNLKEEDMEPEEYNPWKLGGWLYTLDGRWQGKVVAIESYEETQLYALQQDGTIKSFMAWELCDVYDVELQKLSEGRKRGLKKRVLSFLIVCMAVLATIGAAIAADTLPYEWFNTVFITTEVEP